MLVVPTWLELNRNFCSNAGRLMVEELLIRTVSVHTRTNITIGCRFLYFWSWRWTALTWLVAADGRPMIFASAAVQLEQKTQTLTSNNTTLYSFSERGVLWELPGSGVPSPQAGCSPTPRLCDRRDGELGSHHHQGGHVLHGPWNTTRDRHIDQVEKLLLGNVTW